MLFLPLIAVEQWLVVIVLFYFALNGRKTTITAQANFQTHTTVWPETGTSSTLRLKVLILLPGAAELSVLLMFFSFFLSFSLFFHSYKSALVEKKTCALRKQTNCYKGSLLWNSGREKHPLLKDMWSSLLLWIPDLMHIWGGWGWGVGGRGLKVGFPTISLSLSLWIANIRVRALLPHKLALTA